MRGAAREALWQKVSLLFTSATPSQTLTKTTNAIRRTGRFFALRSTRAGHGAQCMSQERAHTMSYPSNVLPFPSAPHPAPVPEVRKPFAFDAALVNEPGSIYVPALPYAFAVSTWAEQIRRQSLRDVVIPSLHALTVDHRDGALCRGAGGICYTPHAWSQLVGLMQGQSAPSGLANVLRWLSPAPRHFAWADLVAKSKRKHVEEGVLRTFVTRVGEVLVPAVRAVVSGRHSLTHFDDSAVLKVIEALPETPVRARIARAWDETHAAFDMDVSDEDTALTFYMHNSETGSASLSFSSALRLTVLDATVVMPSGEKFEREVRLAAEQSSSTSRRHTLPRYSGSNGTRLAETARASIAARRIKEDIDTALAGARLLNAQWAKAKSVVHSALVPLAKASTVDDTSVMVLADVLLELGVMVEVKTRDDIQRFARDVATVMAEDSRLRSLPHGSLAHLAAAIAVIAATPEKDGTPRTWAYVLNLQRLSGRVLMGVQS